MDKFFSKVKSGVKSVARATKRKAQHLSETAQLGIDIKLEESALEECFEKLGRAVFLKSLSQDGGERYDKRIDELTSRAQTLTENIKAYKKRLAEIKGKEVCAHCESVIDAGMPCEYCNEKIVANEDVQEQEEMVDDNDVATDEEINEIKIFDDEEA